LKKLYAAAEQLEYVVPTAQAAGWVDTVRGLPVVKFQWFIAERAIDIDVFLAETPYQKEVMARRRQQRADGWEAWFVTPEDLILLKLLAGRPKDLVDVADVLFVQGKLDETYMRNWAQQINLAEALERALSEARSGL
jgi:hypothetical protein